MSVLDRETVMVQNPGLGAVLLWRFTIGYTESSAQRHAPVLPVLFVVLPILLQEDLLAATTSTQNASGLRKFVDKLKRSRNDAQDILVMLPERMLELRSLTLESIRIAIGSRLLSLDPHSARVMTLSRSMPPRSKYQGIQRLLRSAEKFGTWCGRLSTYELMIMLGVRL